MQLHLYTHKYNYMFHDSPNLFTVSSLLGLISSSTISQVFYFTFQNSDVIVILHFQQLISGEA